MTSPWTPGGLIPVRQAGTMIGLLVALVLTACGSSDGQEAPRAERASSDQDHPNIVVVIADQMRAHAMGAMGNPQIITPNLDKLAAEGILVSNAISGQPVCSPFRAQLIS